MAVKMTRTRTRPSASINFFVVNEQENIDHYDAFENKFIESNKILSITDDEIDDLTKKRTYVFADVKSFAEYITELYYIDSFFIIEHHREWGHNITNGIIVTTEIDYNYNLPT